jgi:hypothetical protein
MNEYAELVELLAKNRVDKRFLNQDNIHAMDVFSKMFKYADSSLRIFAGGLCSDVANSQEYISAISDFIERNGTVKILLNSYDPQLAASSNFYKRLTYYISDGKDIQIKKCSRTIYRSGDPEKKEIHFTIADDRAYRIETDTVQRTADVNYNSPALAKMYAEFFDKVFTDDSSEVVDLLSLFNMRDDADK